MKHLVLMFLMVAYAPAMVDEKGFVKDGLTFDGLHPNKEGYAIMNPLAETAIQRALKSKK